MKTITLTGFNMKKIALAMSIVLPLSANAGTDPEFPSIEGTYLNHVNSSALGMNLLVNPTLDLCIAEVEDAVWTSDASVACDAWSNPAYRWGWKGGIKGGGGRALTGQYAPPGATLEQAGNNKLLIRGGAAVSLETTIEVSGIETVYFQFEGSVQGAGGKISIVLDGTTIDVVNPLANDGANGTWGPHNFVIPLSSHVTTPYTGTLDIEFQSFGSENTDKIIVDNALLFTDAQLAPPTPDNDLDGIDNELDAFPNDPSASVDTDGDGYPDLLNTVNPGCDQACLDSSTLIVDAFPGNGDAWEDIDSNDRPESCLIDITTVDGVDYCGTLAMDTDFDNDGESNIDELAQGSDINNADSYSADLDGDGWANDKDAYPTVQILSQPATNVLLSQGFDFESNTEGWAPVDHNKTVAGFTAAIEEVTDKNGNATQALKLAAGPTTAAGGQIMYRSPVIDIPTGHNINAIRIGAWIKLTGTEGVYPEKMFLRTLSVNGSTTKRPGIYLTGEEDTAEYFNQAENNGWVFIEQGTSIPNTEEITSIQFEANLFQTAGVELLVDNVELNFVTNADLDEDTITDSIDLDDDADGTNDGEDITPLGDFATDNDMDLIIDGYDDDLDNDLIVNALDTVFNPILTSLTDEISASTATFIAKAKTDNAADVFTYKWTINNNVLAESGDTLVIDSTLAEYSGRELTIEVQAFLQEAPEVSSQVLSKTVMIPGVIINTPPTATLLTVVDEAGNVTVTAEVTELDGEDVTHYWLINGTKVETAELAYVINFEQYKDVGTVVVELVLSDGVNPEVTFTETVVLNSAPVITFNTADDNDESKDETGFVVNTDEHTTVITIDVSDADKDSLSISWSVNGFPVTNGDGDLMSGKSITLNHLDYVNGSVVAVQVIVTDGINTTIFPIDVQLPEAEEPDELFPEGKGGSTWWLLTFLVAALAGRRVKSKK